MGVKHWVRAMLVLSALPSAAFALGLGDIRLNSSLNAPLDAEIELVNANAEELAGLRAQLASRETFARYGLEWPSFLGSITLTKAKSADGRDVLRVHSTEAITEPFVTLLVDANWGRGRLFREYTVLLDPPVFAPNAAPASQVQAPVASSQRSNPVERTAAPAPAARPAVSPSSTQPAPVSQAAPVAAAPRPQRPAAPPPAPGPSSIQGDSYVVRRGDTLTRIATGIAPERGASTEQAMVSLYASNSSAFNGSMNDLRAGAVLRVPDAAAMAATSREAALAEVRRQRSEWRNRGSAGAAGAASAGRLRLVPPPEGPGSAASATSGSVVSAASGPGAAAQGRPGSASTDARLSALEQELAESRRLLEVRSAQIADLQRRLGSNPGSAPAPAGPSGPAAAGSPPAALEPPPAAAPVAPAPVAESPAPAPAPAAAAPPEPVKPAALPAETNLPSSEPSLIDRVVEGLKEFWFVPVGLIALLLALAGFKRAQARRDQAEIDDTFGGNTDTATPEMSMPPPVVASGDTARLRRPIAVENADRGFVVEESGEHERPSIERLGAGAPSVAAEDTFSGETGINLDQGDPLAEADFHMAYGLYDQAADLVRLAIAREPGRRDLKLKLAEVYFVWGNREEFLNTARDLHGSVEQGADGEWDKIVIMGKQIAPEDPLFTRAHARGSVGSSAAPLDLPLDAGSPPLDFDVFGDGSGATQTLETPAGRSFAGGAPQRDDVTIERPRGDFQTSLAPTMKIDTGGGTTREMAPRFDTSSADAPTVESTMLGRGFGGDNGEAPTVEQPALRAPGSAAMRAKLDAALRQNAPANDQTAELAIDDLGLDIGHLDQLDDLAANGAGDVASPDAPTLLTDLDEDAQRALGATRRESRTPGRYDAAATSELPLLSDDEPEIRDGGATSMVQSLDTSQFDTAIDLDTLSESGVQKVAGNDFGLDLDIGSATISDAPRGKGAAANDAAATIVDSAPHSESLPPLEPVTISEVGTKLDLARAYMDMGDPDGARNILREVLQEGSMSQKSEAGRLLESLPG
jgi:pilus assembly protein FimV